QRSLSSIQERIRGITPEIEAARALIQTRRQEMGSFEQEQASLRRRLSDTQDVSDRARRAISEVDNNLNRLTQDESRAQNEKARRVEQRRGLVSQLLDLRREYHGLREHVAAAESDLASAERERIDAAGHVESQRTSV